MAFVLTFVTIVANQEDIPCDFIHSFLNLFDDGRDDLAEEIGRTCVNIKSLLLGYSIIKRVFLELI